MRVTGKLWTFYSLVVSRNGVVDRVSPGDTAFACSIEARSSLRERLPTGTSDWERDGDVWRSTYTRDNGDEIVHVLFPVEIDAPVG